MPHMNSLRESAFFLYIAENSPSSSCNMKKQSGFTLLEILAVIAIIGILAAMAAPSYLYKVIREQIEAAMPLADVAKKPVEMAWLAGQKFPTDNAAAGLPSSDKIVNNFVSDVSVEEGVVHITFGNRASNSIKGKVLSLRPAVVEDAHVVPVTWVCANAQAPDKMTIKGIDKTTLPNQYLPFICRSKAK